MLRKTFMVVLTLATLCIAWLWIVGSWANRSLMIGRNHSEGATLLVHLEDGQIIISHWWFYETDRSAGESLMGNRWVGMLSRRTHTTAGPTLQVHRVWFPIWLALVVVGFYPAFVGVRALRRIVSYHRRYRCRKCGYSLIGLTEPRCPECGGEVTPPTAAGPGDYIEPLPGAAIKRAASVLVVLAIGSGGTLLAIYKPWQTPAPGAGSVTTLPPPVLPPDGFGRPSFDDLRHGRGVSFNAPPNPLITLMCPKCGPGARLIRGTLTFRGPDGRVHENITAWTCEKCGLPLREPLYGADPQWPSVYRYCGYVDVGDNGRRRPWTDYRCPDCSRLNWPDEWMDKADENTMPTPTPPPVPLPPPVVGTSTSSLDDILAGEPSVFPGVPGMPETASGCPRCGPTARVSRATVSIAWSGDLEERKYVEGWTCDRCGLVLREPWDGTDPKWPSWCRYCGHVEVDKDGKPIPWTDYRCPSCRELNWPYGWTNKPGNDTAPAPAPAPGMPSSPGLAVTRPSIEIGGPEAASGCPRCGRNKELMRFVFGRDSGDLPTDGLGWMCEECSLVLIRPWEGQPPEWPTKCAYCGHVELGPDGEPMPWARYQCENCWRYNWPAWQRIQGDIEGSDEAGE